MVSVLFISVYQRLSAARFAFSRFSTQLWLLLKCMVAHKYTCSSKLTSPYYVQISNVPQMLKLAPGGDASFPGPGSVVEQGVKYGS